MSEKKHVNCPFCHEKILKQAKKCRFCNEWIKDKNHPKNKLSRIVAINQWFSSWIISMVLFYFILWIVNFNFANESLAWILALGFIVIAGLVVFVGLALSILKKLFSKTKRTLALKYLFVTFATFVGFFFILSKLPSADVKTDNQPLKIQETPVPTAINTSLSPVTVSTQKVNTNNNTNDPNEAIHCNVHVNCGGGTVPLTRAECEQSTCCEVEPNEWEFMKDKNDCDNDNNNDVSNSQNSGKKVQFTTTEGMIDGTYYCYETRVNELTHMESEIKILTVIADICSDNKQYDVDNCVATDCSIYNPDWTPEWSSQCIESCYDALDECLPKHTDVGNKRKDYMNLIYQICP